MDNKNYKKNNLQKALKVIIICLTFFNKTK
jgi:hypothetical protein